MPVELPKLPVDWTDKIFTTDQASFASRAMETYHFQYAHNKVYAQFAAAVGKTPATAKEIADIPFLPVSCFKQHQVVTGVFAPAIIFESSGTTQNIASRHYVKETAIYIRSFRSAFEQFYGASANWCIIGLLPSYLERRQSSLVMMVDDLIRQSQHPQSGFYLYEHERLAAVLQDLEAGGQQTLLIGVTFALLDFAEKYRLQLRHTVIMETGGMKGRREEWTRQQVHAFLEERLGVNAIHSEYGMTELLSQAYSKGSGLFRCPPWMKVLLRGEDDPLSLSASGNGLINIIDLANIYSCSFIATDDVGSLSADGSFEVTGRMDNADLRGCSLMTA